VKFIADGMLGKLTRWLRMLGQDVTYSNKFDDSVLIMTANKERRVLLTKDLNLYKCAIAKGIAAFYVEGQTEAEKLAELAKSFDFPLIIDLKRSRCPKCNGRIRLTLKEQLADIVEKNTFIYYNEFWKCKKCSRIYWQGAHWEGINATLEKANRIKG